MFVVFERIMINANEFLNWTSQFEAIKYIVGWFNNHREFVAKQSNKDMNEPEIERQRERENREATVG